MYPCKVQDERARDTLQILFALAKRGRGKHLENPGLRHLPHKLERSSAALALSAKSDLGLVGHLLDGDAGRDRRASRAGALARLLDGDAGGFIEIRRDQPARHGGRGLLPLCSN